MNIEIVLFVRNNIFPEKHQYIYQLELFHVIKLYVLKKLNNYLQIHVLRVIIGNMKCYYQNVLIV